MIETAPSSKARTRMLRVVVLIAGLALTCCKKGSSSGDIGPAPIASLRGTVLTTGGEPIGGLTVRSGTVLSTESDEN
ncbi:MAG: hypothetical protein KDC98_25250, partial [Planctomycetes bacterium]|nr:hypothetical protein [Planctomycetota bacterium]